MTDDKAPRTILCIASFDKGHEFIRQCKRSGWRVLLLTSHSLKGVAKWPTESIDEIFYMPDVDKKWDVHQTVLGVSHLARTQVIDRVVPLDDFDLETAAAVREHLRVPGMGETTTRYFRDKLAMRMKARSAGVLVPEFVHVLNDEAVRAFTERVPPPWVLKPRLMAGAIGIQRIGSREALYASIEKLGDEASFYVLERFVAGDIFHVDSLVYGSKVLQACASGYGRPPLDVAQDGEVFTTRLLVRESTEAVELCAENAKILSALGLVRGASHTELIRGRDDGKLYFLETSARVGGAHIADLIEAATGMNPWAEWAKIELAGGDEPYAPPVMRSDYAGLLVSLAREERPDTSSYADPEIVWRMEKKHHVGFIVRSESNARVAELLDAYARRVKNELHAFVPAPDRPLD